MIRQRISESQIPFREEEIMKYVIRKNENSSNSIINYDMIVTNEMMVTFKCTSLCNENEKFQKCSDLPTVYCLMNKFIVFETS